MFDDKLRERLRNFIFTTRPQPFPATPVYQDMNGALEGSTVETFPSAAEAGQSTQREAGWNGAVMVSMKKMMLGAALAVGAMAMTAAPAQAAVRIGIAIGGPVAYVPPCPGPGYVWVNGYWAGGAWVPGYWNFAGGPAYGPAVGFGVRVGGPAYHFDHGLYYRGDDHVRGYDHGDRFRR